MFDKLKELVEDLPEGKDFSKYAVRRDTRKTLQLIKAEAQALRVKIVEDAKK
jgi:hypothetical protein